MVGCISTILHRGSFTIPLPQVMHTQNIYIFASFITLVVCVAVGLEIYMYKQLPSLLSLELRTAPTLRSLSYSSVRLNFFPSIAEPFTALLRLNFFLQCCGLIFFCSVAA